MKYTYSVIILLLLFISSCSKTQSYSDLLKNEQKCSNWFLAQQKVCNEIPSDSAFLEGPDAPFYKMDDDGYIYMQVLKAEPRGEREIPDNGATVYFTYSRYNIDTMYKNNTLDIEATESNQDNFINSVGNTYFIFGNYSVSASATFGSGIQLPLSYLGYNSEVNILLKSYYGFSVDNTTCIPYLVNIRYFKAEY